MRIPFQLVRRVWVLGGLLAGAMVLAQEPAAKPKGTPPASANEKTAAATSEEKAGLPFQIELLETHIRFEANGDSRKEVHTIVKINEIAGARQFSRLGFDYNRAFQQVEIPLVRVSHANGGTSEILPSAITDAVNPAVEKFPAYQDVRVKSVRILGLQDGDTLEYRVITTTTKHPLAPDFWLEHTFDRSGQVLQEDYAIDLPAALKIRPNINPETPATEEHSANDVGEARDIFRWQRNYGAISSTTTAGEKSISTGSSPDVTLSTFGHWRVLSVRIADALTPGAVAPDSGKSQEEQIRELQKFPLVEESIREKAAQLIRSAKGDSERTEAIYNFVSGKIATVDLPLGATGYSVRSAAQSLASGYATQEDKFVLFDALAKAAQISAIPVLTGFCDYAAASTPRPSVFVHLDILSGGPHFKHWLDPSLEVAPFGMIVPIKEQCVLMLARGNYIPLEKPDWPIDSSQGVWKRTPKEWPFASFQKVDVTAEIDTAGILKSKVSYTMRGQNELVLRMAFHQTAKERWNEVAGLLALADGFRGSITSVKASEPMETKEPFTVEYEITQAKFVDWSKKPVRIPALLPQIALPDAPGKTASEAGGKIELGTPLEVETRLMLRLPEGTLVQTPPGTSVVRDYATYASKYEGHLNTLTASRHVHFLLREIGAERGADYGAFVRAVQIDQAQAITLFPPAPEADGTKK